jgi:hypothetical protein
MDKLSQVEKLSDNSIKVTKQPPIPDPVVTNYDLDFLVNQRATIIKQANDFLAARQVELDDVQALLDQCDSLGVVARVMPEPLVDNSAVVATPPNK